MKDFLKRQKHLIGILFIGFLLYFPSLFVFYTNDDFFFLRISNAKSLTEFLNFFNIFSGPDGFGMYRPLATQVFYFLSWRLFNLNSFGLHVISFIIFFGIIYLIYKLIYKLLGDNKIAIISAFLYATSATHFGHLYYLATFQELLMTFFVLLACIFFTSMRTLLAFLFFVLALMSKETAVVTPVLFLLIYWFQKSRGFKVFSFKKMFFYLLPFLLTLAFYLLLRIFSYGFAIGDSYVWDFSLKRLINTLSWYFLWSFNIPETLVDFVGPGLKINPNLLLYWSKQIIPIFALFVIQTTLFIFGLIKRFSSKLYLLMTFCLLWFVVSLVPVAFLPLHKFTFYLTLPLVGIVYLLAYVLTNIRNQLFTPLFLFIWTFLSILTIKHTVSTNWITQGETVAKRTYDYVNANKENLRGKTIVFYDTSEDKRLPFSPTQTLKNTLSNNNFFEVFFDGNIRAVYGESSEIKNSVRVNSRRFLAY